jgi:hypothetical protein
MSGRMNRRRFLQASALAGAGFWAAGGVGPAWTAARAASDKLNVAFVGVGGMGGGNLSEIAKAGENVVALCDIDDKTLSDAAAKHRKAEKFNDFRQMFDKLGNSIDAVVVSTPDHCHAAAGVRALKMGKHLYCEKPLTYSVHEARLMRTTAAEKKVATCMGNRGTATNGFRAGVELVQAGILGGVREAHIWTNRPGKFWKQGMDRPKEKPPVPKHVHWDLWLGPAPERPYAPGYHPFAWRGWVDFGTGALGDMACHTANLPFMGLKLLYPSSVESTSSGCNGETYPLWTTTTYQFPARGDLPAVKLVWYDGMKTEKKQNHPPKEVSRSLKLPQGSSGFFLIGDKGVLLSLHDYGDVWQVLDPDLKKMAFKQPEPTLPRAPKQSQYLDWLNACKGGKPALANFDYAGILTETVVLGNVPLRAGKKIEWNGEELKATNAPEAAQFVKREYRKGWEL